MSSQLQRRREAWSFLQTFVGAVGELIYDTTYRRILMQDGVTLGGIPANAAYAPNNSFLRPNCLEGSVETITPGGTTYGTALEIPAGALLVGVSLIVIKAITGCTAFELGTSGSPSEFATGLATAVGSQKAQMITPTVFAAATPLQLTSTAGGNFTAGSVRLSLQYLTNGAPQS